MKSISKTFWDFSLIHNAESELCLRFHGKDYIIVQSEFDRVIINDIFNVNGLVFANLFLSHIKS